MQIPIGGISRALVSTISAIHDLPANYRAIRRAKAEAKAEFEYESKALDETIKRLNLHIDDTEASNALGYYMHHDANITKAVRSYRGLLESGQRLPGSNKHCQKYGREFREKFGKPTEQDRVDARDAAVRHYKRGALVAFAIAAALLCLAARIITTGEVDSDRVAGCIFLLFLTMLCGLLGLAYRSSARHRANN